MALGTMTSVAKTAGVGPVFTDRVTQVGDGAYTAGGTTGLLAKLRALRGDQRLITKVIDQSVGANYLVYTPADDKIHIFVRSTGVELANGADAVVYTLAIESV